MAIEAATAERLIAIAKRDTCNELIALFEAMYGHDTAEPTDFDEGVRHCVMRTEDRRNALNAVIKERHS